MKTKNFNTKNFLVVITTLFIIGLNASCKKENRIEKNLWKKGGEWSVESYSLTNTSTESECNNSFTESGPNGTILLFREDGSGLQTEDGVDSVAFTYSNTEDNLILIVDGEKITYDIVWEKDKIDGSSTYSFTCSGGSAVTAVEKFTLKKK
jgi:hypothetical protein